VRSYLKPMSEHFMTFHQGGQRHQAEISFVPDANHCRIRLFSSEHSSPMLITKVATPREVHTFFTRRGVRVPDSLMDELEREHFTHQIVGTCVSTRQQVFHHR